MSSPEGGRILSIQSHVVHGYVGNKAAVFPLQCLGWDVDDVNTVNFSNHSGYARRLGGTRTKPDELKSMLEQMERNGLLNPQRLLTGYTPNAEALRVVSDLAQDLRRKNPDLVYLLDPVMGDSGQLYVAADVIPVYIDMLKLATVITPNWFEVETLTGIKLNSISALRQALEILHNTHGVPHVAISSIPATEWLLDGLPERLRPSDSEWSGEWLISICSSRSGDFSAVHTCAIPRLPGYFTGVGDLFSALIVGKFDPSRSDDEGGPLSHAVAFAVTTTYTILKGTHEHALKLPEADRTATDDEQDAQDVGRLLRRMRGRELRVVQGVDVIRDAANGRIPLMTMTPWTEFWDSP